MKIAMIASEAAPFVKTGGLGDVLQALPDELARVEGNEVALFLPYYKTIKQNPEIETELLSAFTDNARALKFVTTTTRDRRSKRPRPLS